jgi:hypothetical protein
MFCAICNKELKRPGSHFINKHGLTLVDYYRQYEPQKAAKLALVEFFSNHYVTIRSRYSGYKEGRIFTVSNRGWALNDKDLMQHVEGVQGLGVYFPKDYSIFIGIDVDSLDKEVLNRVYNAVRAYGVDDSNMLISFSGRKGYHLDIFLSEPLAKKTIKKFFNCVIRDAGVNTEKEKIELFGGSAAAYKLPLGYHYKTGAFCYPCDEWGNELPTESIFSIEKLNPQVICDAVEINFVENPDSDLQIAFADLCDDVKPLESYNRTNESNLKRVEALISSGVHFKGARQKAILAVAAYCKDIKRLSVDDTIDFLLSWVAEKWSKSVIDREVFNHIKHTALSVYKHNFRFNVSANKIEINLPEIREIFSVKSRNKLQSAALRKLYFILLRHAKAYADCNGVFFMSYYQMQLANGSKERTALTRQIKKLVELGKVEVISSNQNAGGSGCKFKRVNQYRLPRLQACSYDGITFTLCNQPDTCKDCYKKAAVFLIDNENERKKLIAGWEFRKLEPCQKNQKTLPFM